MENQGNYPVIPVYDVWEQELRYHGVYDGSFGGIPPLHRSED